MTKVQIYNEAITTAQTDLSEGNPMAFEVAVPQRALALGLTPQEFALFNQTARTVRNTLLQLAKQDAEIAAQFATTKANATPKAATPSPQP